jgi:hypothetical protein
MVNLYAYKDTNEKQAGISYTNERYIPFKIDMYSMNRDIKYQKERNYGASLEIYGPLIKKGRDILEVDLKYYLDDKNKDKNPTVFSMNYSYKKDFALEQSPYFLSENQIYLKEDRGDISYGLSCKVNKHIVDEYYLNIDGKIIYSNTNSLVNQRGIEVVTKPFDTLSDKTNILIEGNDNDMFVKNISKISIGGSKAFHFNRYYSSFPISLRKESIFYRYNYFNIETTTKDTIKEKILGINLNLLVLHKLPIPLSIKYIQNDSSVDDYKVLVTLGMQF